MMGYGSQWQVVYDRLWESVTGVWWVMGVNDDVWWAMGVNDGSDVPTMMGYESQWQW